MAVASSAEANVDAVDHRVAIDPNHTRRAIVAVTLASGAVGFTTTAVTVGTRGMAQELHLSTVELGWVVNAYLLSAAALVLAGGRLGDSIGRVRTFDIGLAVFAGSSLLGVVAPGVGVLVAARIGQGIGAALILPSSIEVIHEYAQPGGDGRGFRWRGLAYASSFAIGPLVGGVLTDWFSWRWIFVLDAAIVLGAGLVALPLANHKGRGAHRPTRDLLGAGLAAALIAVVVLFAERLAVWEFVSVQVGGLVLVGIVLALLLLRHEQRTEHPLLHRKVIEDRRVLGANLATVGASIGMLSLLYFFNLFAQSAATFSGGAVSVLGALVPFLGSMVLCAAAAHWLGHRWGHRGPVTLGLVLMVVGFAWLTQVTGDTTRLQLLVPLAVAGVGAGIANASLTGVAVLGLPAGRMNEAAGWISLSRFLGSAMALAVGTATYLSVAAVSATGSASVAAARAGGDAFDAAAAALNRDLSGPLLAATQAATAQSFARTMGLTAAVLAVIALVAWWLLRPDRRVDAASAVTPG